MTPGEFCNDSRYPIVEELFKKHEVPICDFTLTSIIFMLQDEQNVDKVTKYIKTYIAIFKSLPFSKSGHYSVYLNDTGTDVIFEAWGGSTKHPDLYYRFSTFTKSEMCIQDYQIGQWIMWIGSQQNLPFHADETYDFAEKWLFRNINEKADKLEAELFPELSNPLMSAAKG